MTRYESAANSDDNREAGAVKQSRDPAMTQARILRAAKAEFAKAGFGGARVESIALRAKANKRLIYHYFKSKENLFLAVLEDAYVDIRTAEKRLELDHLPPKDAIIALLTHTWNYYLKHPEFIALVNSENLHRARHVKKSALFAELHQDFVGMLKRILDRGVAEGTFRAGIDPVQLHITMAAVGYYYLTNQYTGRVIYGFDFADKAALDARLAFNIDSILRILAP